MGCGCRKGEAQPAAQQDTAKAAIPPESEWQPKRVARTSPLDQCLFCAQKHADEALTAMNEFTYELENRSFIHGSMRSVVNHTFKSWPEIATKAREAALLWQEAKFDEAQARLREAAELIDAALLEANPEIQARLEKAMAEKDAPAAEEASGA